ncbi:putative uncharacterized protein [Mycoplasma sp. CAG:611]|nr:putative uncharacterized protein [Mycoplasma sp. CAG:611]
MYKKIILSSFIIFILSTLFHSLYNYLPCFLTSIIVPVNESIFEHMKMIFTSYMFYLLIKILFNKKHENNLISSFVIASLFNIVIFLIIYIPIYLLFGEKLVVTLILYFITILISNYLMYKIQNKKINSKINKYSVYIIPLVYIVFTLFTYFPLKNMLFLDPTTNTYGIIKTHYIE